jgi:hypothetical protein
MVHWPRFLHARLSPSFAQLATIASSAIPGLREPNFFTIREFYIFLLFSRLEQKSHDKQTLFLNKTIAIKGSNVLYVRSVYQMDDAAKKEKEKASFRNINDGFRKIFIQRPLSHFTSEGYLVLGLADFLLDDAALTREYTI